MSITVADLRYLLASHLGNDNVVIFVGPEYVSEGLGVMNENGECIAIIHIEVDMRASNTEAVN